MGKQEFLEVTEAQLMPSDKVVEMLAHFEVIPLPHYAYKQRPANLPLTRGEVCAALIEAMGNVTAAAVMLKVSRNRVAYFIKKDSFTSELSREVCEMVVDQAEQVVTDAMRSEDDAMRYQAARFMLTNSRAGKLRGYGVKFEAAHTLEDSDALGDLLEAIDGNSRSV